MYGGKYNSRVGTVSDTAKDHVAPLDTEIG